LAPSFDTVGWLTRDVATSIAVAGELLPASSLTARRTVLLPTINALAQPEVRQGIGPLVQELSGALPPIESGALPESLLERWFAAFRTVQGAEAWQSHGAWIAGHPGALGADVAARFALGAQVGPDEVAAARAVVAQAREWLRDLLEDSVLAMPAASGPAPARTATAARVEADRAATLRMTCLAGLCGAPAVSLPLLPGPVGLCLVGPPGTDSGLLQLAARVEELR
jgi:Asp-tRNA(Asn)/Glu-tRNA(Gln) amidotransferase A subunit family amidase